MTPLLADYHVHTAFSVDCQTPMATACQAAIEAGLAEVAFADHADFGPDSHIGGPDARAYFAEIEACRRTFGDRLTIRAAVELGEPHLFTTEAEQVLSAGPYDLVIGSAHYAAGMQAAWRREFFDQPLDDAYEAYFRQVAALAASGDFDVLGHLDLVKRDARRFGRRYDGPEPFAELIRAALASLAARGKALELNTSPLYRGQAEPCPSEAILRWYRELGGELLTVGSDAHEAGAIGRHLDTACDMARACGFTRLARFEARRAAWSPL